MSHPLDADSVYGWVCVNEPSDRTRRGRLVDGDVYVLILGI